KEEGAPSFRTATELMRQFWKNRRQHLNKAGISNPQSNAFLEPLINYMECQGKISAPATIVEKTPDVLDAFISFGILQRSAKHNINFCHQRYLDHLIAERLLRNIFQESDSVLSWLGKKGNQSLFRREQLRQALAMLSEESPTDFFNTTRKLLESKAVRFHLKHLVLELIGQFDVVADDIGEYFLELLNKPYWREHVQQTVFLRHHPWVSYLLNAGLISKWLESDGVREINSALWLLHSVAEDIPDPVTEILAPLVDRGSEWPNRILTAICRNEMDDSEKMFELRLQLARLGVVKDFVIWESLCAKYPLRAVQLIEAVLSARNINDRATSRSGKNPLECLYDDDLEALNDAVEKCPSQTWNLLMPHVERLTNIPVDDYDYDERLQNWREERTAKSGMDVARGTVELLKRALATEQPDELIARIAPLKKGISPIIQEIIIAAYTHLPARYADTGIAWLLDDLSRFRLGFGYREPEWMPAVRLVEALSPHCSEKLFRRLEEAIYHYHAPEEKREARYCVKLWRKNAFCHYWGKTQHFLLPALDATRVSPQTSELIRVLERKFANYAKD
ncbi:hypothetical protein, partial [Thiolapillus sp.]|uniref:hypothetical protein n=1 Tax=Thiolapillus sp. TaxID=2017437 RepID=UPI0025D706AE